LELRAESSEEVCQFLLFRVVFQVRENFDEGIVIPLVNEAERSYIRVLEGPALALRGGDSHGQSVLIAFPGNDNCGEAA
jgi:hypothetical protein